MTIGRTVVLIAIKDLPKECGCGSKTGVIMRKGIEAPSGELLMEVRCKGKGCGKKSLIPDRSSEESRRRGESGKFSPYHPTWRLNPETNEIVPYNNLKKKPRERRVACIKRKQSQAPRKS